MKTGWLQPLPSFSHLSKPATASSFVVMADLGVDIVRMPPGLPPSVTLPPPSDTPLPPVGPGPARAPLPSRRGAS